jgi:hypothetical protein
MRRNHVGYLVICNLVPVTSTRYLPLFHNSITLDSQILRVVIDLDLDLDLDKFGWHEEINGLIISAQPVQHDP